MSDNKRSRKYNNLRESKRTIILAKKEEKDGEDRSSEKRSPQDHLNSQPKILLKTKEKSAPISIASRESSSQPRVPSPIPTPVNIAAHKELAAPVIVEQPAIQIPIMKTPINIITDHYQLNTQPFEYLVETNTNFFVVGIIGTQGIGKSTLLNMLGTFDSDIDIQEYLFQNKAGVFPTRSTKEQIFSSSPTTEGIQMYITKDRVILLDCSPILCNPYKKDYVSNELDDLKMLIFLISVCHLLIIVQDDLMNLGLVRLLTCAEMMKPNLEKESQLEFFPNFLFVKNMATNQDFLQETRDRIDKMYKCFFKQSKLRIFRGKVIDDEVSDLKKLPVKYDINLFIFPQISSNKKSSYSGHPDVDLLIAEFRQRVLMSPRHQLQTLQQGLFSEKNWSHLVVGVWDSHKNNYFLRKYENFKEKEWTARSST